MRRRARSPGKLLSAADGRAAAHLSGRPVPTRSRASCRWPAGGFDQCEMRKPRSRRGAFGRGRRCGIQAPNDKQQVHPMQAEIVASPKASQVDHRRPNTGDFSVVAVVAATGGRRTGDRDGPSARRRAPEPALRGAARGAEVPDAGRGDVASAKSLRPSARRLWRSRTGSRCSGSSKPRSDSVNFPCAGSKTCAASGPRIMAGNRNGCCRSISLAKRRGPDARTIQSVASYRSIGTL